MVFLETFRELVYTPGIPGYEDRVRELILSMVKNYGKTFVDSLGNLVLEIGEGEKSVLLAAHMDELGLVVTHIEDDGKLRFRKMGGIDDRILPSQHVVIHSEKGDIPGIIGLTPPHLRLEKEVKVMPWNELFIDVGADSAEEARSLGVEILDPVTFYKPWSTLKKGKVIATRSVDDRFGCAVLIEIARMIYESKITPKLKVYLAWTVQEEVGLRGALALAHMIKPSYMISIDTTTCCNPAITGSLKPGNGPTIRAIDNAGIISPRLVKYLIKLAKQNNIPVQPVSAGGGTDMAAFQRVNVLSAALGVPVKYTHSTTEYLNLDDVEKLIQFTSVILEDGFKNIE